jgi:hypothetical protein
VYTSSSLLSPILFCSRHLLHGSLKQYIFITTDEHVLENSHP